MNLVCPRDHTELARTETGLVCAQGHSYPARGGIPIFILSEENQTHTEALRALDADQTAFELSRDDGQTPPPTEVHPLVRAIQGATSGYMFYAARDRFASYPIPDIRLPEGKGQRLLDIGCNWGRWSVSAAQKGYRVTGIDPSFGALVVAKRVCRQLGVEADFICADARHLPFPPHSFDVVYSYSVIQHFSKDNARNALREVARVLKTDGTAMIQMPNRYGIRCLYHQIRKARTAEEMFSVRYWTPSELLRAFTETIGPSRLTIDGFFGLGVQAKGSENFLPRHRAIVRLSEFLRRRPWLAAVADSLFVHSAVRRESR